MEVEDRFIKERMNEMILKKGIQLISPFTTNNKMCSELLNEQIITFNRE